MNTDKHRRIFSLNCALFGDTINRLDSLILEIRHIQGNIIRQLREPVLYKLLRYEEDYLWGTYLRENRRKDAPNTSAARIPTSWLDYLEKEGVDSTGEITKRWIMAPPHTKADRDHFKGAPFEKDRGDHFEPYFDPDEHARIFREINRVFLRRNISHGWGPELTSHYNCLVAAQALKRDIVSDKIILTYWANQALSIPSTEDKAPRKWTTGAVHAIGRFMTIRSGAMFHMKEYLSRIKDLRAPVERELNFSTVEYPHPMTSKRKEQGFYTEFLSERATKYFKARKEILQRTNDIDRENFPSPLIMHRWKHQTNSSCEIYKDDILSAPAPLSDSKIPLQRPRNMSVAQCFVNSSFWMSDRPDLQPGIAREVSRYFVQETFDDIGEAALKYSNGEMASLFRNISKIFYVYRDAPYGGDRHPMAKLEIIREIAADLIASSKNSHAYLWSQFLNLIGLDMYETLETPTSRCDLTKLREAERAHHALQYDQTIESSNHLWSVRLLVLVEWVKQVGITNRANPYAEDLESGIPDLVDILLEYIEGYTPLNIADGRGAQFFHRLKRALYEEIQTCDACKTVRKEQEECIDASMHLSIQNNELPIDKLLPKEFTDKFSESLKAIKDERRKKTAPLEPEDKSRLDTICPQKIGAGARSYLASVQDVSWILNTLRSEDLFLLSKYKWHTKDIIKDVFEDFNPGYDFYSVALETHIWLRSRPIRILSRVVRVVGEYVISPERRITSETAPILDSLLTWLIGTPSGSKVGEKIDLKKLRERIKTFKEKQFEGSSRDYPVAEGAISLIQNTDKERPTFPTRNVVRIETLEDLHTKITDNATCKDLAPLISYLAATPSAMDINGKNGEKRTKQLEALIASVADSFNYIDGQSSKTDKQGSETDGKKSEPPFSAPLTLLHITVCEARNRHAVSSLFPDPKTPFFSKEHGDVSQTKTGYAAHYALMLGRHDLLGIAESNYLSYTRELELGEDGKSDKPYTVRAERALPFKLFDGTNVSSRKDLSSLCAAMHIKLTGRDSRLNFLLRIKEGLKEAKANDKDPLVAAFRKGFHSENCIALLTEGSNDIVFLFFFDTDDIKQHKDRTFKTSGYSRPDIHDKLLSVFEVRKAIHQDFLVESVETVPSAICMDLFSVGEENKCFSFEVSLRLRSDRSLEKTIDTAEYTLSAAVSAFQGNLNQQYSEEAVAAYEQEECDLKNKLTEFTKKLPSAGPEAINEVKKKFTEKLQEIYRQRQQRVLDTLESSLNSKALEKNVLRAHRAPSVLPKWQRTPGRVDYNLTLDSHLANAVFCGEDPGDNFERLYKLSGRLDAQEGPTDLSKIIDEVITKINYEGCADES